MSHGLAVIADFESNGKLFLNVLTLLGEKLLP